MPFLVKLAVKYGFSITADDLFPLKNQKVVFFEVHQVYFQHRFKEAGLDSPHLL